MAGWLLDGSLGPPTIVGMVSPWAMITHEWLWDIFPSIQLSSSQHTRFTGAVVSTRFYLSSVAPVLVRLQRHTFRSQHPQDIVERTQSPHDGLTCLSASASNHSYPNVATKLYADIVAVIPQAAAHCRQPPTPTRRA